MLISSTTPGGPSQQPLIGPSVRPLPPRKLEYTPLYFTIDSLIDPQRPAKALTTVERTVTRKAKSRRKDGSVKMESASSARQGKHVVCPAMSVERKWEAVNILQESLPGLPEGHVEKAIFSATSSRFECWSLVLDGGDGELVSAAVFARHYKFGFIELAYIATSEAYRGGGYGRSLLHTLMQQWVHEGFTEVISSVDQKAVGFFQAMGFEEAIRIPKFVYAQWIDTYGSAKTLGCDIGVKLARLLSPRAVMASKRIAADPGCPVSVLAGQENAPGEDEVWCRARITNNQAATGLVTITYRHGQAHRVETLPTTCPRLKIGDSSNTASGLPHFPASTKVHQYPFGMGVQWPAAKCSDCVDRRNRAKRCKNCHKCLAKHCICRRSGMGSDVRTKLPRKKEAIVCGCNTIRCPECGNCLASHCTCVGGPAFEVASRKRSADDGFSDTPGPTKVIRTETPSGISRHCQCEDPTPYPQTSKTRKPSKAVTPDNLPIESNTTPEGTPIKEHGIAASPPNVVALAAAAAVAKVAAKKEEAPKPVAKVEEIPPMVTRRRTRSMSKDFRKTTAATLLKDDSSSSASTSSAAKAMSSTSASGHKYGDYRTVSGGLGRYETDEGISYGQQQAVDLVRVTIGSVTHVAYVSLDIVIVMGEHHYYHKEYL
ncbi:hypothetical protein Pmar_PMAR022612 [Perkinsus marinus ATCC 50983]|uniref:N-acetyltransferase domain-containing protein n=1 Tax=Perkinsus marinus (strain ATCC 50983 / TXsc) TaxID=423536 RepID=C5KFL3_PERM5|nr:hypothetical protein Pmar_PMAR022612 [Perkinsus marinus ATCC 50983]EER16762.1 hypothetical protein Pmar_PMAR022612 [Perkinsus marinus ATCC 50983]|eukprot:XP_002784966.1 hypothetical protein Pmar_PMAR022612 [Perkinsus marinus ATCC 50983]